MTEQIASDPPKDTGTFIRGRRASAELGIRGKDQIHAQFFALLKTGSLDAG